MKMDVKAWCAANQEKGRQRRKRTQESKNNLVQLPLWPEQVRAVPNGFLRSALFGITPSRKRRFISGEQIAALDGIEITYRGERLDQGDLDVWESLMHIVRLQKLGKQCRVTTYALLKMMGKTDTGKNRQILQTRLERLRATALTMRQADYTFIGGLIDEAHKDERTREWVIVVNPNLSALFAPDQFTQIDWDVRYALKGRPLAQWLDGFYASHAKPFSFKVETLHKLCGSQTIRMDHFRQDLRKSLHAAAEARKSFGEKFSYSISIRGLVSIDKQVKGSQRRHLLTRRSKK